MKQISVAILQKKYDDLLSVSQHDHEATADSAYGFIDIFKVIRHFRKNSLMRLGLTIMAARARKS